MNRKSLPKEGKTPKTTPIKKCKFTMKITKENHSQRGKEKQLAANFDYTVLSYERMQTKSRSTRKKNDKAMKITILKKTGWPKTLSKQNHSSSEVYKKSEIQTWSRICSKVMDKGWRYLTRRNTVATRQGRTQTIYTTGKGAQVETIRD